MRSQFLASSFIVVIALLTEFSIVKSGFAQEKCGYTGLTCVSNDLNDRVWPRPSCTSQGYEPYYLGKDNLRVVISNYIKVYKLYRSEMDMEHEILQLPINRGFLNLREDKGCSCQGDIVCFPRPSN